MQKVGEGLGVQALGKTVGTCTKAMEVGYRCTLLVQGMGASLRDSCGVRFWSQALGRGGAVVGFAVFFDAVHAHTPCCALRCGTVGASYVCVF